MRYYKYSFNNMALKKESKETLRYCQKKRGLFEINFLTSL